MDGPILIRKFPEIHQLSTGVDTSAFRLAA
jgi:hypothetical protein